MWLKVVTCLSLLAMPATSEGQEPVLTKWVNQKLDHFNENDTRTWEMRYMVNDKHFKTDGPLFVQIHGFGKIHEIFINTGPISSMAEEHKAFMVLVETRYSGESYPTKNLSVSDLQYMSIKQSVEDIANIIRTIKKDIPSLAEAKTIAFGSSFLGSLAAWTQSKYPDLVYGGWVSSGQFLAKLDFPEYLETVSENILILGSRQCYDRVKNGFTELQNSSVEIQSNLNICNNFDELKDMDISYIFHHIRSALTLYVVLLNDVEGYCKYILKQRNNIAGIAVFAFDNSTCKDVSYENFIKRLRNTTGELKNYFIKCNELGGMITTRPSNQIFGNKIPLNFYTQICSDLFGKEYTKSFIEEKLNEFNEYFGGRNPPNINNFYFTYGKYDPAKYLAVDNKQYNVSILNQDGHARGQEEAQKFIRKILN